MTLAGDLDLPRPCVEVRLVDRLARLDHHEADRAAEREAVRRGADVADRLAVAAHDLGVEQQRLRILAPGSARCGA